MYPKVRDAFKLCSGAYATDVEANVLDDRKQMNEACARSSETTLKIIDESWSVMIFNYCFKGYVRNNV